MKQKLTTTNHDRDRAGLKYIYPVISRRSGGVSIGINFNPNNACNWRCVYCQVPDLTVGSAPEMDFFQLEYELVEFLRSVISGEFYQQFEIPQTHCNIKDIAISGNGEPTSLKQFNQAVALIGKVATTMKILPISQFVLITNGSFMHRPLVQAGLDALNQFQGQVWFKLDSATDSGRRKINQTKLSTEKVLHHLKISSQHCQTCLQTCLFKYLSSEENQQEQQAYLNLLRQIKEAGIRIEKIMLYSLARPSLQPEALQIKALDQNNLKLFADRVIDLGFQVQVSE